MKKFIPIFCLLFCTLSIGAQTRIYVSAGATGANNGASWADAFIDLQSALFIAQPADSIWVAEGTYYPTSGADRNARFEIPSGAVLLGGFAGTETDLTQRDWQVHPAVLSGDIGAPGDSTDNIFTVLYLPEPDSNTVVDGLYVQYGNADDSNPETVYDPGVCGGGMYIMGEDAEAYPIVRNCIFRYNTALQFGGGAMVNGQGDGSVGPRFINCRFENNHAHQRGGGVARYGAAWVERGYDFDGCVFFENIAGKRGGGLYYLDSDREDELDINNCLFERNYSGDRGGGAYLSIGRVVPADTKITGTDFIENKALSSEAGLLIVNRGFYECKDIEIIECDFNNNFSLSNNALPTCINIIPYSSENSIFQLHNTTITDNTEFNINSSIFMIEISKIISIRNLYINCKSNKVLNVGVLTLEDSILITNSILHNIIITVHGAQSALFENILCKSITSTNIQNNFLINSSIIANMAPVSPNNSVKRFYIRNSILSGISNPYYFLYSDIQTDIRNSYINDIYCVNPIICGPGLITGIDPMFIDSAGGDFRLQTCSPLVNAGNNSFVQSVGDIEGNARIQGGTVDMGAYETSGPALAGPVETTPACPGGANGGFLPVFDGGCLPLDLAWTNASGGTGGSLSNLPAGLYTVTVTDQRGSSLEFQVTVPNGDAPAFLPYSTDIVCGDTVGGTATAGLANSTQPFQLLWEGGNTDTLRTNLLPGQYPVTVTEAVGCSAAGTVTVSTSGSLSIDIAVDEISCHGAADGAFTVTPANGLAPFGWLWESGATAPTLGPIGPGNYAGTLTDAFGCTIQWELPLGEPETLVFEATPTPATGPNNTDGAIIVQSINGGTSPYVVNWSNGQTGWACGPLLPGVYTATVTDAQGCTLVDEYNVTFTGTEEDLAEGIKIWPNPVTETLQIAFNIPGVHPESIALFDTGGRLLVQQSWPAGASGATLYLESIPAGVYTLEVRTAERLIKELIVKR